MNFLKIFIFLVGFSILAVLPSMNPFEESESESCSLKKLHIDGADKIRNMSDRKTVNRKVLSFSIDFTSFKSYI